VVLVHAHTRSLALGNTRYLALARARSRGLTRFLALAGLWAVHAANAIATASEAQATPSPQTVIETRQAGFKKMGAAMKAIVEQLKSAAPDNARMVAAADAIHSGAQAQLSWFPDGTGPEAGMQTDALPYIWKERAKFDSLANRLIGEVKTLSTALSGNDLAAVRAQVKVVSDACSTCHRSFRAD
jgi:cytochrome c556